MVSKAPYQLSLFPEIGFEGRWCSSPNDLYNGLVPDLAAYCSRYWADRSHADPRVPRKASAPLTLSFGSTKVRWGFGDSVGTESEFYSTFDTFNLHRFLWELAEDIAAGPSPKAF
jgi:hypothetical protein